MFDKLKGSIRDFSDKVKETVAEKEIKEELLEDVLWDLELELMQNNVAQKVVEEIKKDLKDELVGKNVGRTRVETEIKKSLKKSIRKVLKVPDYSIEDLKDKKPGLVLFMGFNGSGKTTTLAKIAHRLKKDNKVLLAAGDTYRSAAIDQLEEHGKNLDLNVIKHDYGSDGAAVIYDAREHAKKQGYDIVLADTAGRSHSDKNLMEELDKVCRVNSPDLKILVVDALSGNDVVEQAEKYKDIGFDGIVVTKVDVDKKGGATLSLGYLTGRPILFLGTGQGYEDLEEFDPDVMVERLLS